MKKAFKFLIFMICALIFCVLPVSCGSSKTKDNAEITALSFGYLTESAYNNGNYSEGSITRQADFSTGEIQYMIVDFKLKSLMQNTEDQSVKVEVRTSDSFALTLTVQEAPTGKFDVIENDGGSQTYNLFYMLPSNMGEEKDVRMILKLVPNTGGSVDVTISVSGNGQTSVKGITSETATFRIPSLNLKFTLQNDGTYSAAGIGSCTSAQLVIPSIYNGKFVTSVGANEFSDCGKLTGIIMPDSITSIGDRAFYGCHNLTDVDIPDGVTSVGSGAFSGCTALTGIDIPDGVTNIGSEAFFGCVGLESVDVPESVTSIGSGAFSGCTGLTSMTLPFVGNTPNGTSGTHFGYIFGADSYSDNGAHIPTSIKTVTITGDADMGEGAFYNCGNLTNVTISDAVTRIGDFAFYGCSGLTSMTVPDGASAIGTSAFTECKNLKSITIGNGITSIGDEAFRGCVALTEIAIPETVTSIGAGAFSDCRGLISMIIPESVTSIGKSAFSACVNLSSVTLPFVGNTPSGTNDTHFGYIFGADSYSDNQVCVPISLKTVVVTSSDIDSSAFYGCAGLTSVTIGDGVTGIGLGAFYGCNGLTSITLSFAGNTANGTKNTHFGYIFGANSYSENDDYVPISLKTVEIRNANIGASAFYGCSALTNIMIGNGVMSIGSSAFADCVGLKTVEIPNGVKSIGFGAFNGCKNLTSMTLPFVGNTATSNPYLGYIFGASYYTDSARYVPSSLATISVTSGAAIGTGAFYGCDGLTSVSLPDGVTSIGSYAFAGCVGLNGINIPSGVTSIGKSAFYGCSSLSLGALPVGVTSIGDSAFSGCVGLTLKKLPDGLTSIGASAFLDCTGLTSIHVPDGVKSIGFGAFNGCENLTSMTLPFIGNTATSNPYLGYIFGAHYYSDSARYVPSTLLIISVTGGTKIGTGAFYGCSNLMGVTVPDSITSIGASAFYGCSRLLSVNIPNGVTSIGDSAFCDCSNLLLGALPDSVTSIGESAFSGCIGLTLKKLPDSVTSVGSYAFYDCSGLKTLEIPNSVTSIGFGAFSGCNNLTSMTLPFVGRSATSNPHLGYIFGASYYSDSARYVPSTLSTVSVTSDITNVGTGAFYGCNGLKSVLLPATVTSIGNSAFYGCFNLTSVNIPNGVTSIGKSAFYGCSNLLLGALPDSVTSIGESAFYGCAGLTMTAIPNGVTSIGDSVFSGCTGLTTIEIPDSVKSIGSSAFAGCTGLTTVEVPNSVTSIGLGAFYDCNNLTSMTLPFVGKTATSSPHLGYIFGANYYSDSARYVPSSLKTVSVTGVANIGTGAFYGCNNLTSVTLADGVTSIGSSAFYNCGRLKSVNIPNTVTSIGNSAFYGCAHLSLKELPDGLTSIGDSAFRYCEALAITELPDGITTVGSSAFSGCTGLKTVEIPDSVKSIGFGAFSDCKSLTDMTLPFVGNTATSNQHLGYIFGTSYYSDSGNYVPSSLKTISVTGGTKLGTGAFYGCKNLTNIILPDSVKTIGSSAFYGCTGLTGVRFNGKVSQWQIISFGSSWNYNTGDFVITCTNGTLSKDGTVLFR